MSPTFGRLRVGAAIGLVAIGMPLAVTSALASPGTFTRITTPSQTLRFTFVSGASNHFHVSGKTSLDVTSVDIHCVTYVVNATVDDTVLATSVPVASGQFSATATMPSSTPLTNCTLKALPTGVGTGDYLGSFTGPTVYSSSLGMIKDGSTPYGFASYNESGDGVAIITDAGTCGTEVLVTVAAPQMLAGPIVLTCAFALAPTNITAAGTPTGSAIQVNGRNAYLPGGVHSYLINSRALTVAQPAISATRHVSADGDATVTESAKLMRCSGANTFPPTTTSCPSLVATGVVFTRTSVVTRDNHQVKIRDTFTSTDHHAHSLALQYLAVADNQSGGSTASGAIGYIYPRHGNTFRPADLGHTVTGLGSKAGSILVRSDVDASRNDPVADTVAETWSRAPASIRYDAVTPDEYGLRYPLNVPAGGKAYLGFALSERWLTADVRPLAAAAAREMVSSPTIAAPHKGATINGEKTTVKGRLAVGANGLPTSVQVNGHKAKVTRTSSTAATYSVHFKEPKGAHRITVTATDSAGNVASTSVRVHNS